MKKAIIILLLTMLIMTAAQITASADMGPKPKLTIYIENPPDEPYYLDLLTQKPSENQNLKGQEKAALNQEMLNMLFSQKDEGWHPAYAGGTKTPLSGKLTGTPKEDTMIHTFGYYGLPDTYRIIIVTESGKIAVTEPFTIKALQSSITYDYSTGKATIPPTYLAYLVQFIFTFPLTILIEGAILLLFGFSLKKNWAVFLLTNLSTQIFLTATLGAALIKGGTIDAILVLFPLEAAILLVETAVFSYFLSGKSLKRKTAYSICANLATFTAGFFLTNPLFDLLIKML